MTGPTVESCLENAEKYIESSWDSSKELRLLALRAAVNEIIEAVRLLSTMTKKEG